MAGCESPQRYPQTRRTHMTQYNAATNHLYARRHTQMDRERDTQIKERLVSRERRKEAERQGKKKLSSKNTSENHQGRKTFTISLFLSLH